MSEPVSPPSRRKEPSTTAVLVVVLMIAATVGLTASIILLNWQLAVATVGGTVAGVLVAAVAGMMSGKRK